MHHLKIYFQCSCMPQHIQVVTQRTDKTVKGAATSLIFYALVVYKPNLIFPNLHVRFLTFPSSFPNSFYITFSLFTSLQPALQLLFPSSPLLLHPALVPAKHKAAHHGCSGAFSAIRTCVVNDLQQRPNCKKSLSSGHNLFLRAWGREHQFVFP